MDGADTIAAISTPPGEGGIGIVRLSGPEAISISSEIFLFVPNGGKRKSGLKENIKIKSRRMYYGAITDPETGDEIDEVLLAVMPAPRTYTREHMVEINCHGGALPLQRTLELVLKRGARLALPGEFTKRAFLNGRIDLTQAEAVLEVIRAKSEEAGRHALAQVKGGLGGKIKMEMDRLSEICARLEAAIDFPEDEIETGGMAEFLAGMEEAKREISALSETFEEGRILRDGVKTAILGKPNVGKSSILNSLLGEPRAIVTEVPGTTRDIISEFLRVDGHVLRLMDTAGIRGKSKIADRPEMEGIKKSIEALDGADLVLCVLDGSSPLEKEDFWIMERISASVKNKNKKCILVVNKTDLPPAWTPEAVLDNWADWESDCAENVRVSAKTGEGMDELRRAISESLKRGGALAAAGTVIMSIRHKSLLVQAARALERAIAAGRAGMPEEIISMEAKDALCSLGAITGSKIGPEEILDKIFGEFCIGK